MSVGRTGEVVRREVIAIRIGAAGPLISHGVVLLGEGAAANVLDGDRLLLLLLGVGALRILRARLVNLGLVDLGRVNLGLVNLGRVNLGLVNLGRVNLGLVNLGELLDALGSLVARSIRVGALRILRARLVAGARLVNLGLVNLGLLNLGRVNLGLVNLGELLDALGSLVARSIRVGALRVLRARLVAGARRVNLRLVNLGRVNLGELLDALGSLVAMSIRVGRLGIFRARLVSLGLVNLGRVNLGELLDALGSLVSMSVWIGRRRILRARLVNPGFVNLGRVNLGKLLDTLGSLVAGSIRIGALRILRSRLVTGARRVNLGLIEVRPGKLDALGSLVAGSIRVGRLGIGVVSMREGRLRVRLGITVRASDGLHATISVWEMGEVLLGSLVARSIRVGALWVLRARLVTGARRVNLGLVEVRLGKLDALGSLVTRSIRVGALRVVLARMGTSGFRQRTRNRLDRDVSVRERLLDRSLLILGARGVVRLVTLARLRANDPWRRNIRLGVGNKRSAVLDATGSTVFLIGRAIGLGFRATSGGMLNSVHRNGSMTLQQVGSVSIEGASLELSKLATTLDIALDGSSNGLNIVLGDWGGSSERRNGEDCQKTRTSVDHFGN
jgi:hypothetical protein